MGKTPYRDLGSQDILSAHISGIQHDINKIQEALDMKEDSVEGHVLDGVHDQDDPALRYRIYEGTVRNWLDDPKPVIYRNGSMVDEDEYIIQPAYGVIVFHEQQKSGDEITADFSYIDSDSNTIDDMENNINIIIDDVNDLKEHADEVDEDITTIDEELQKIDSLGGATPFYSVSGSYMSHQYRFYNPFLWTDGSSEHNRKTHHPEFNVLVYGDTLDVFPFPVATKTKFKRAGMMLGDNNSDDVKVKIGIYKDNGALYPSDLIFQSPEITVSPDEWGYEDIDLTLEAGLYWIARHDKNDSRWNGLSRESAIAMQKFDAERLIRDVSDPSNPYTTYGGYRMTDVSYGDMPDPFPSNIEPFERTDYCSPWLIVD